MSTPTYAQTLTVPTIAEEEADLLTRFTASQLAGWPPEAPQRQLLTAEAQALQFEMIQRAAVAYAASPARVLQLKAFLITMGYSATDAAAIASAWVDIVLEIYQSPRKPATKATWIVAMKSASTLTIDASSVVLVQADDGTIFESSQVGFSVTLNSGNNFRAPVLFTARNAGTSGNVVPGTITHVMSGPAGLQVDLNGSQTLALVARDVASDEEALALATSRWGTLSGELTAAGWVYVLGNEVRTLTRIFVDDTGPDGPGSIRITLANASGPATALEVLQAQNKANALQLAGGGKVTCQAAIAITLNLAITVKTDGSNPLARAQVASALVQVGGKSKPPILYLDALIAASMNVAGVVNVASISLGRDVNIPMGKVVVINPTVTAT